MKIWIHEKGRAMNGFILSFVGVQYFSGFVGWHGANFRFLTDEQASNFKRSLGRDINGTIVEINSIDGKIYFSGADFKLELKDYMPKFMDGISLE